MSFLIKFLALSTARVVAAIGNILFFVVAARYLSQAEYGELRRFSLPYEVFSPMISLGIPAGIFLILSEGVGNSKTLIACVALILVSSAIFFLGAAASGDYYNKYLFAGSRYQSLVLLFIFSFAQTFQQIVQPFAVSASKPHLLTLNSVLTSIALTLTTYCLLDLGYSNVALIICRSVILVIFSSAIIYSVVAAPAWGSISEDGISEFGRKAKKILTICLPLAIASSVNSLSLGIDKLIVSAVSSKEVYAIYSTGAMELPLIGVVVGALSTLILSEMVEKIKNGDKSAALELFRRSGNFAAVFVFPVFACTLFYSEEIIVFLFSGEYRDSATVFSIYLLVLPARIVVFGSAIIALGKGSSILFRSLVELVINAIISGLFYLFLGVNAVPFGMVISTYFWSIPYNLWTISRGFSTNPFGVLDFRYIIKVALVSMMVFPIIFSLDRYLGGFDLRPVFSSAIYLFACWFLFYKAGMLIAEKVYFEINIRKLTQDNDKK